MGVRVYLSFRCTLLHPGQGLWGMYLPGTTPPEDPVLLRHSWRSQLEIVAGGQGGRLLAQVYEDGDIGGE